MIPHPEGDMAEYYSAIYIYINAHTCVDMKIVPERFSVSGINFLAIFCAKRPRNGGQAPRPTLSCWKVYAIQAPDIFTQ